MIGYIENNGQYTDLKKLTQPKKGLQIPKAVSEEEGFFGPESMHWKIYREPGIIVAGVSALLLQIAHPAVAEGVKVYSEYQTDFLGRAHRTILSMTRVWFGSKTEATASAQRLYHIHGHIKGIYYRTQNGQKVSFPYCANEPELLNWVLATMTMATIQGYEKIYRPLADREKALFFEETKKTAQLMGIPLDVYPDNWLAFTQYYKKTIEQDILEVGNTAGEISEALFAAYFPFSAPIKTLASGFLPPVLRRAFRLKHNSFSFYILIGFFRLLMRLSPKKLRYAPQYHQALYRIATAHGNTPSVLAKWHHWIANTVRLPIFSNQLYPK